MEPPGHSGRHTPGAKTNVDFIGVVAKAKALAYLEATAKADSIWNGETWNMHRQRQTQIPFGNDKQSAGMISEERQ
jgi:hypothetical protein